jgi:hypothetical protein
MTRGGGRALRRDALVVVAAALLGAAALVGAERALAPRGGWTVTDLHVVPVVAAGEPVVAWVAAACPACRAPLLQVRLCPAAVGADPVDPAACGLAARVPPAPEGTTRVRYPRPSAPGAYRVEVLLLDADRLGTPRTTAIVEGRVDVR